MTEWSIAGKGLKLTSEADAEPYVAELKQAAAGGSKLEKIVLSGNTLGIGACQAFAAVIKTISTLKVRPLVERPVVVFSLLKHKVFGLQVADYSDIFTGRLISEIPTAISALCDALIGLPELIEVNLSDNAFGGRTTQPLVPFLSQSYHTLQVLRLKNNGLGPEGGTVIAQALLDSATSASKQGKQTALRVFVCGQNRLEDGSSATWSKAFAAFGPSIQEIRLYQNGIRATGITAILQGLQSCPSLRILDLNDNCLTERGPKATVATSTLARSLPLWPALHELQLNDCLLSPRGSLIIAEGLAQGKNPLLTELKLQSNELDARAVWALEKAVKTSLKQLSVVELNGNRCEPEEECMVALVAALEANGFPDALDKIDDVCVLVLYMQLHLADGRHGCAAKRSMRCALIACAMRYTDIVH